MFTKETAEKIALDMIVEWDKKDLNHFLNYFTDDVELISSNIQRFIPESNGVLKGKETLKNYWEYTLNKFPYADYKLQEISFEENKLIMKFFNSISDKYSIEILSFNENMKVYKMVESYV